ncbi:threonine/serine exporter family protein [Nonomuraea sp. NPDC050310]|uniref:threonine/serine ThrE exporter family protein n=1 Tax=Nonomuraea sp. NPDC050310 TaxID=3154935 RepID=UPI0033D48669
MIGRDGFGRIWPRGGHRWSPYTPSPLTGDGIVDPDEAPAMLRFVLHLGEQLFRSGAETGTVEAAVLAATRHLGMGHLQIDFAARSIHLQYSPPGERPMVMLRTITTDGARDLHRLSRLHRVVGRLLAGELDLKGASAEVDRIAGAGAGRPWWVDVAGGAVLAAMICLQAGGTQGGAVLAALLLVLVNRVGRLFGRVGIPAFYTTAAQAALTVGAGAVAFAAGLSGQAVAGMLAANLVLLLPILSVVSLAEDAIMGFPQIAAGRAITVTMLVGGIIAGTAITGSLVLDRSGFELAAYGVSFAALPFGLSLLSSAVGAAGNTLFNGGSVRLVPLGVAAGLLAGLVNQLMLALLHSPPLAALAAATVLGAWAAVVGTCFGVPSAATTLPGVTGALLPGPTVYASLVQYAKGSAAAPGLLLSALATTAAIGVGVVLGTLLATRPSK